ncbi:hypothetical protein T492DRAFT_538080 [Pavlovales sp. CCMP2436]|nr:hypothetical protein T492DRAFT_538080 [Pavlovales sp. CCMP2436]
MLHLPLGFHGANRSPAPLKGIDVQFMKELQKHVPIIPVIAKADTMTIAERDAFRRHMCDPPSLPFFFNVPLTPLPIALLLLLLVIILLSQSATRSAGTCTTTF